MQGLIEPDRVHSCNLRSLVHTHTHVNTHKHNSIPVMHYVNTHKHNSIPVMHAHTRKHAHTNTHTHTHMPTHTHTHTHTHTNTHTHTHTNTERPAKIPGSECAPPSGETRHNVPSSLRPESTTNTAPLLGSTATLSGLLNGLVHLQLAAPVDRMIKLANVHPHTYT